MERHVPFSDFCQKVEKGFLLGPEFILGPGPVHIAVHDDAVHGFEETVLCHFFHEIDFDPAAYGPHDFGSRMDFPEAELRLYAEYFVSGVMAVYLSWLQGELSLSFDELARLASEATFHGIRKSRKTGDGL